MPDGDGQPGDRRVTCAVCATEYDDEPNAHRIRRCPACGSRLIRQGDGRLGAVATAAPPPPKPERSAVKLNPGTASANSGVAAAILLVIGFVWGLALLPQLADLAGGLAVQPAWLLLKCAVVGTFIIGGLVCARLAFNRNAAAPRTPGRPCIACAYPLPPGHVGRCTECGRLQDPHNRRNWICPGCRRTLRGLYVDACPECGADVRLVTDGTPPDEQSVG